MGLETAALISLGVGGLGAAGSAIAGGKAADEQSKLFQEEASRTRSFEQQKFDLAMQILQGGTLPGFEEGLEGRVAGVQSSLAPFGVTDSSISQRLVAREQERALGQDQARRLQFAQGLLGQTGGTNQAALLQAQGAGFSPTANLLADVGQFGTTLGTSGLLGGGTTPGINQQTAGLGDFFNV